MPEQVFIVFHPTRLAYFRFYFIGFILILISISIFFRFIQIEFLRNYEIYFLALVPLGVLICFIAEIMRRIDTYTVTNYRIIEKRGIINIKEDSINWEKISNFSLTQNAVDRLFNIGTIRLYSMGGVEKEAEVTIKRAPHVHKIKDLLEKLIERK